MTMKRCVKFPPAFLLSIILAGAGFVARPVGYQKCTASRGAWGSIPGAVCYESPRRAREGSRDAPDA